MIEHEHRAWSSGRRNEFCPDCGARIEWPEGADDGRYRATPAANPIACATCSHSRDFHTEHVITPASEISTTACWFFGLENGTEWECDCVEFTDHS